MRAQRITIGFEKLGAILAVIAALLVSGCSENSSTSDAAASQLNVEVGMSQNQVLAIMGQPQRRETHGGTEFLIYATDNNDKTALLRFIPIAIVDGRVTGLGRHVYDHVIRSKSHSDLERSDLSPAGDPRH